MNASFISKRERTVYSCVEAPHQQMTVQRKRWTSCIHVCDARSCCTVVCPLSVWVKNLH